MIACLAAAGVRLGQGPRSQPITKSRHVPRISGMGGFGERLRVRWDGVHLCNKWEGFSHRENECMNDKRDAKSMEARTAMISEKLVHRYLVPTRAT